MRTGETGDDIDDRPLDAGRAGHWIDDVLAAIQGDRSSDVPCGTCSACCASSQFVHIGPDEVDTLAHVPTELTFAAPGLPTGHLLLGYDEQGRCPMLVDDTCSIYAHRPRTCRTYDCRVFSATGIEPEETKVAIARRTRRWRFATPTVADRRQLAAVRAAASLLHERRDELAQLEVSLPTSPTQLAVLAIELHPLFVGEEDGADEAPAQPPLDDVTAAIAAVAARHRREVDHRDDD